MIRFEYIDASILVKPFLPERDSDSARSLLAETRQPIASNLARLEVIATLNRAAGSGRLRPHTLLAALATFDEQWTRMGQLSMDAVQHHTIQVCSRRKLRAADAIHLGSCLHLRSLGAEVVLLCADQELLAAAKAEGFDCRTP